MSLFYFTPNVPEAISTSSVFTRCLGLKFAEQNHKSLNVALFASFQLSQPDYLSRKKSPFTEHEFTGFVSVSLGEMMVSLEREHFCIKNV